MIMFSKAIVLLFNSDNNYYVSIMFSPMHRVVSTDLKTRMNDTHQCESLSCIDLDLL
jgi:hypothetical protein